MLVTLTRHLEQDIGAPAVGGDAGGDHHAGKYRTESLDGDAAVSQLDERPLPRLIERLV
jgi:hypothetical protein